MEIKRKEELYYKIQMLGIKVVPLAKIFTKEKPTRNESAKWVSNINKIIDELNDIKEETLDWIDDSRERVKQDKFQMRKYYITLIPLERKLKKEVIELTQSEYQFEKNYDEGFLQFFNTTVGAEVRYPLDKYKVEIRLEGGQPWLR